MTSFNEIWFKGNLFLRNVMLGVIIFLLSRLIYVLLLVGIQIKDTQLVIEDLSAILTAMATKFRVKL